MYLDYIQKGFSVIPEKNGKGCLPYKEFFTRVATEEEAASWYKKFPIQSNGIGMICGDVSGIIVLDFDTNDKELIQAIEKITGQSPVKRVGSKGYAGFYRLSPGFSINKKVFFKDEKIVLEVLGNKHKITIPPSYHRETKKQYTWADDKAFLDVNLADIPEFTQKIFDKLIGLQGTLFDAPKEYVTRVDESFRTPDFINAKTDISEAEVQTALNLLSPDCGFDEWVAIGLSVQSELGSAGEHIFNDWSAKSAKKFKKGKDDRQYRTFDANRITIGTLLKKAGEKGFRRKKSYEDYAVDFGAWEANNKKIIIPTTAPKAIDIKTDIDSELALLETMPGVAGHIARWIESEAIRSRPALSMAAALTYVGMILGQKVRTALNGYTNLYILGFADSGEGKDFARKKLQKLNQTCGLPALQHLFTSSAGSGEGLFHQILKYDGKMLWLFDEFHLFIKKLHMPNASGHIVTTKDRILGFFSSADGVAEDTATKGELTKDEKDQVKTVINNPALCIYATAIKGDFLRYMMPEDLTSGFLNRFLILESKHVSFDTPKDFLINRWDLARKAESNPTKEEIPAFLINITKSLWDMPSPDFYNLPENVKKGKLIDCDAPETFRMIQDFWDSINTSINEHKKGGRSDLENILKRKGEIFLKLISIVSDGTYITKNAVDWSISLLKYSERITNSLLREEASETQVGANKNRIVAKIKAQTLAYGFMRFSGRKDKETGANSFITETKNQYTNLEQRMQLLQELAASGIIKIDWIGEGQAKKPDKIYYLSEED
jgi:hypothetical protein